MLRDLAGTTLAPLGLYYINILSRMCIVNKTSPFLKKNHLIGILFHHLYGEGCTSFHFCTRKGIYVMMMNMHIIFSVEVDAHKYELLNGKGTTIRMKLKSFGLGITNSYKHWRRNKTFKTSGSVFIFIHSSCHTSSIANVQD